jgi:hypothetical protein
MIAVPAMNVCGNSAYPAEIEALPYPAAPPAPGSPVTGMAGMPPGRLRAPALTDRHGCPQDGGSTKAM